MNRVPRPRALALAARPEDRRPMQRLASLVALAAAVWLALAAVAATRARAEDAPDSEPFPVTVAEPAKLVSRVPVSWPEAARRDDIRGVVVISARVGRDGRVRETRVANSIPGLDDAAVTAVRRYEFSPATDQGHEVETWVLVPVRFDESLGVGARSSEPAAAPGYTDADRGFESDVEVLRQNSEAGPDSETIERHAQVMRSSLGLEMIPAPGEAAIRAFLRGDSLAQSQVAALHARRKAEWTEAARLAPWWPLPCRRLASVAIAERDYPAAAGYARVILAGRSSDEEALATLKRVGQLQWARAPKKKGKK